MILEEAADTFIQLVLLLERSGFHLAEFEIAVDDKLEELKRRLKAGKRW